MVQLIFYGYSATATKITLKQVLFFKCKPYKYRYERRSGASAIKNKVNISERSKATNSREEQCRYEGDTIVGENHKGAIVTMVDRKSRYTMLDKAIDRTAKTINSVVYKMSNIIRLSLLIMAKRK